MNSRLLRGIGQALLFLGAASGTQGAVTSISSAPLVTSGASAVLPNLMFILDDSGSMGSDYMPDWANDNSPGVNLYKNSRFNGVAYDPAVTYQKPVRYATDGTLDTTTYPSQTGTSATTGANTGVAMPNWKAVKNDAYGVQSTSTSDLTSSAYFYTFLAGEYCTNVKQQTCAAGTAPSVTHPVTAYLRWCDSAAHTSNDKPVAAPPKGCQAVWTNDAFFYPRYPGLFLGTSATTSFTVSASTNAIVTGITANGLQILNASTASSSTPSTVASNIVAGINACTLFAKGNCQVAGYSATRSSSTVTITAPATIGTTNVNANGYAVVMSFSNTLQTTSPANSGASPFTMTAFAGYDATNGYVPGSNVGTEIVSTNNSYPYPGTATKASTRTDCAGTTCTYTEEMTNYANWYTYYRTRMQMMKTSTSIAFQPVGATYRVGYFSINNNTGTDFLNVSDFNMTQKRAWYAKLFAANPNNSTPLHPAMTNAGRIYAGMKNGDTFNGSVVVDPMQYSCQQNFTILSTDGYWNSGSGYKLNGTTTVGQQDGTEVRPFVDSSIVTDTTVTPWSKVDRKTTVTPVVTTTPYTRTITTVATATPTLPTSCLLDNGSNSSGSAKTWCITTSGNSNSNQRYECNQLDAGGNKVYACRGNSAAATLPTGGAACKTDVDDNSIYCIFNNSAPAGALSCEQVRSGNNLYGCRFQCPAGQSAVSVQTQTSPRTLTGSITSEDDFTSTFNRTVVITNGVAAPPTDSLPTVSVVNVTPATMDAGSVDSGVPDGSNPALWTNSGSAVVSCSASPPAAGTSPGVAGAATTVNGTPVVTTTIAGVNTAGASTTTSVGSGGTSNTLADVAEYYYKTDLRTAALTNCTGVIVPPATAGSDVCSNDVPATGEDAASWQHMTTFTLGLGASGKMLFSPSYASATTTIDDYYAIKNGISADGVAGICTWQATGTQCNWPVPVSNTMTTIDDLWHTAVNGRGTYFSATNPATLSAGLSSALSGVSARLGSSAAATTSNPNVTSGDNFVFSSTFSTQVWDGELVRQQIDLTTGVVSTAIDWAAQDLLDLRTHTGRTIYTFDSATANKLKAFTYASLTSTEQAYFNTPNIAGLSQFCSVGTTCLSSTDQSAAAGNNLVNFLRGQRTNEGVASDTSKYYRQRNHLLGDIVTAEAVYVKKSLFQYLDRGYLKTPDGTTYTPFVTANNTRRGMVYAASNDGMLHAFYAASAPCTTLPVPSASPPVAAVPADCDPDITTGATVKGGDEAWAYIPSQMLPNLYKLADKNYSNQHSYFVDGTPVVADICTANCNASPTVVEDGLTASIVIASASWAAGVATITTAEAHGYSVNTIVVINGMSASGYNGTFTITEVPNSTTFKFALVADPGSHPDPVWKTILVGGFNAGGRGYYALDITDPLAPKALWEYTETNMGYTFGNPEITKLKDGTWVVLVTSGYNNLSPGDGVGRLYVINANTGTLIRTISTGTGSPSVDITTASWSANVATITTSAAHGFVVGDAASITGVTPNGYNGTFTVTAVPSATQFRYALTTDPFVTRSGRVNPKAVSAASWAAGTVTMDTTAAHGLTVGTSITVTGFDNANTGYNGTFLVTAVPSTTRLQYAVASDPGGWTALGSETVSRTASITTPWAANVATITTATAHGLAVGNTVTVAGFSPSGYSGTFTVTAVPTTTTFRYTLATDPGTVGAVAGGTPSNLGRIRAWVDNATNDNTALRVYGGDMFGNVWRFDINGDIGAAGYDAHRMVTLYTDAAGTARQPITSRPELGEITVGNTKYPVVFVGTGRYLGTPDLTDLSQQTMYAIKDNLDSTSLPNPHAAGSDFVEQVQTTTLCPSGSPTSICRAGESVRTTTNNAVDFSTKNGWYVDFPDGGERDNTDPVLQLGTLVFNTNVPNVSACTAGGYSYTWFLDYRTGGAVSSSTTGVSARRLGSALATRPTVVRLPNNTVVALTRLSDGTTTTSDVAIGSGAGTTRRVSWRELITE
ncbi:MAG: PilC/PilY family type IV pilus protein [Sulfuritalea sp.]|nr:PilC/PilY family type IV pilus protein [Sulfuritalea sp.]